jgi:tetratricopeptide (TPR) repeat protein
MFAQQWFRHTLADVYRNWGATFVLRGRFEDAVIACNRALDLDPSLTDALYHRALALEEQEAYTSAIADYDALLRLDSKHVRAHLHRGICHYHLRMWTEALGDLNMALYLQPTLVAAYIFRGLVSEQQRNPSAAISDYCTAMRYAPQDPTPRRLYTAARNYVRQ